MPAMQSSTAMNAWVDEFGSPRLQKAKVAGFLEHSVGVYRQERLALDRPGWKYVNLEQLSTSDQKRKYCDINCPTEGALDAYLDATERYATEAWRVMLKTWYDLDEANTSTEILTQTFLGRLAGIDVANYLKWMKTADAVMV